MLPETVLARHSMLKMREPAEPVTEVYTPQSVPPPPPQAAAGGGGVGAGHVTGCGRTELRREDELYALGDAAADGAYVLRAVSYVCLRAHGAGDAAYVHPAISELEGLLAFI